MPARNPRVGKSDVNQRQKSRSPSKHHLKPRVSTMAALDDAHDQRSPSPTAKIKEGCEKCGLAVGFIVAMSSTAIALQTLKEKGLANTHGGKRAFAVLLFQDIAVIPMLALFPLLATVPTGHADRKSVV